MKNTFIVKRRSLLLFSMVFALMVAELEAKALFAQDRILFVTTNISSMGKEGIEVGNYQIEVAPPYKIFVDSGFKVDFVSPSGGEIHLYGQTNEITEATKKTADFNYDRYNSLSPEQVDPSKYKGVFYVGGYGVPFDVASNQKIASVASLIYNKGGVIGASGHGPISLPLVLDRDGNRIIENKKVTGFPNSAEERSSLSNYGKFLPITVEDSLVNAGGVFQSRKEISSSDVVVDGRIVTTMFAFPAKDVAQEMVDILQKK